MASARVILADHKRSLSLTTAAARALPGESALHMMSCALRRASSRLVAASIGGLRVDPELNAVLAATFRPALPAFGYSCRIAAIRHPQLGRCRVPQHRR